MTPEQQRFMNELRSWDGVASSRDLGPQISQKENSARQFCKRRGWVVYTEGYWRITTKGYQMIEDALSSQQRDDR